MEKGDDPYAILGVSNDATNDEIKKAYRKLALKNHPDKQKTEEEKKKASGVFAKIAGAYELLTDDFQRKEYDRQQENDEEEDGFDGNAEYDYDYDPSSTTTSTALALPTAKKTGRSFFGRRGKKKKKPVKFSDPYEVFKKAFEDEFGVAYPGAKLDKKKVTQAQREKKVLMLTNGEGDTEKAEKKGGFMGMFRRNKNDKQLVVSDKKSGQMVQKQEGTNTVELDNKPISMETTERKIEHPDGTIETITEMTITRPDGSTETMRRTDKPDKGTANWNKPKNNGPKMLTDGSKPHKQLTNGTPSNKKQIKGAKKPLAITGGKTTTAIVKK